MRKRHEVRKARLTPIVVAHDDWPWPELLVATEVSPEGLYIAGDRLVPPGECVRLSYRLGTPDRWEVDARVTHHRFQRRYLDVGYSGFGLELLDISPLERMRMRLLLRKCPPPVPPSCVRAARGLDGGGLGDRRRQGRKGGRRRDDPPPPRRLWGTRLLKRTG